MWLIVSSAGPVHPDPSGFTGAQPVWRDRDRSVGAAQHAEHAQTEELRQRTHAYGGRVWSMLYSFFWNIYLTKDYLLS